MLVISVLLQFWCLTTISADDIILITTSVTTGMLQNLLFACEKELTYLDMLINSNKKAQLSLTNARRLRKVRTVYVRAVGL